MFKLKLKAKVIQIRFNTSFWQQKEEEEEEKSYTHQLLSCLS